MGTLVVVSDVPVVRGADEFEWVPWSIVRLVLVDVAVVSASCSWPPSAQPAKAANIESSETMMAARMRRQSEGAPKRVLRQR